MVSDAEKEMIEYSVQELNGIVKTKLKAKAKRLSRIHEYSPEQIALFFFVLGRRSQHVSFTRGDIDDLKKMQEKLCDHVGSMIKIYTKSHPR